MDSIFQGSLIVGLLVPYLPYNSHKNPLKYGNGMGSLLGKEVHTIGGP